MDPLTPERWRRIEALFSSLADAPREEQARVLGATAVDDAELAAVVEGMLAHAGDSGRLQQVVDQAAATFTEPASTLPPRFGAYRTVGEIGRGGMGVVYEGVSDDEFRRRVAIKVAPLARVGAAADARFRLERQILSSLEHPHIARFLDAGTEAGVPYLVMEFVQGVPITTYVATRAAPARPPAPGAEAVRRLAVRASAPGRASRSETRQHPRHRRRHAQVARLRGGEAARQR